MFSNLLELTGLSLIAIGIASLLGTAAGLIFAGTAIVLVGGVTDDAAVGMAIRRGVGWVRYGWHRQILRESGVVVPSLRLPTGWVPCDCGMDEGCPVCGGLGHIPDPQYRENSRSPHPPIKVNPQSEAFWSRMARARQERARLRDRTPALTRHDDDLERLT